MPVDVQEDIDISFKFFGLPPSASLQATKEAYRRYYKEFHPDLFPKDSDEQKLASEKMIAANHHFEKLEKFFEEFPEGKTTESGGADEEPHDDNDWEVWDKQRHSAFDDELKEWKERQASMEAAKTYGRESFRRGKLVRNCRVGLVVVTLAMWYGWYHATVTVNREIGKLDERERSQDLIVDPYQRQMHEEWVRAHPELSDPNNARAKAPEMPGKFILLLLWTAGAGWLLFSARGKGLAEKYLSEAKTEASV